jgi:hypothetical protein
VTSAGDQGQTADRVLALHLTECAGPGRSFKYALETSRESEAEEVESGERDVA